MCPPAHPSPSEIGLYWSDEQIISILAEYTPGSHLPDNVLADSSPYQYPPSNLPEGIWYLVHSNEKKEYPHGFWKAKGNACKVYSNAMVSGWRTTLEYFEGLPPHGQITDWLMQEYMMTPKVFSDKDEQKESRLLCRVFLCSGHSSKSEMNPENCKTSFQSKDVNPVASFDLNVSINSDQDSGSESQAKREDEVGELSALADIIKPNSPPQVHCDLDCFARGDFLELNDLLDPESHSSSSQNSSCPSKLSDEYFDSLALLRDLEEEENNYIQGQNSGSRYNFNTLVVPNDVVFQPDFAGSVPSGSVISNVIEASITSPTIEACLADSRVQENATKRHNPESKSESTSSSDSAAASSTSHKPSAGKKAGGCTMKKLKTLFCFATF